MANAEQQNVTVTLPAQLLRQVRHLAVDRGVSLSRFIALLLESEVEDYRRYEAARERQLALMEEGLPLGTHGKIGWDRAELHER
jgi:metal-responsive CopG/Arc/MetJ family transcriptional regulator